MFKYSPNIALNVRDHIQAVEFYKKVLGFSLLGDPDPKGTQMKSGDMTFWIDEEVNEAKVGRTCFEFVVDDLQESIAYLQKQGCKLGQATSGEAFLGQMIDDPFGMRFHLYQPKKKEGI